MYLKVNLKALEIKIWAKEEKTIHLMNHFTDRKSTKTMNLSNSTTIRIHLRTHLRRISMMININFINKSHLLETKITVYLRALILFFRSSIWTLFKIRIITITTTIHPRIQTIEQMRLKIVWDHKEQEFKL